RQPVDVTPVVAEDRLQRAQLVAVHHVTADAVPLVDLGLDRACPYLVLGRAGGEPWRDRPGVVLREVGRGQLAEITAAPAVAPLRRVASGQPHERAVLELEATGLVGPPGRVPGRQAGWHLDAVRAVQVRDGRGVGGEAEQGGELGEPGFQSHHAIVWISPSRDSTSRSAAPAPPTRGRTRDPGTRAGAG